MSTRTLRLRLAFVASIAAVASVAAYGCSSGDNSGNPTPSGHDAGGDSTASSSGGDSGGSSGQDAPSPIDTGSCTSDASTCNSCLTAAQDPLNACAPETVNCQPFSASRVPTHPTL
jgi:hypothetical protein